jgi:hypothetical protein
MDALMRMMQQTHHDAMNASMFDGIIVNRLILIFRRKPVFI